MECNIMEHGIQRVSEISAMVESKLIEVGDFLLVKAEQFCTMGSYPFINLSLYYSYIGS